MNGEGESSNESEFPHGNRVLRGLCHWEHAPEVEAGFGDLLLKDPFAHGNLLGQIAESKSQRGLGGSGRYRRERDYRCPLEYAPTNVGSPPWLGELKAKGRPVRKRSNKHFEWRLYFGEAINRRDHVIGIKLGDKKPSLTEAQNRVHQRKQIGAAMKYLKRYFKDKGYRWAPFPG